MDVRRRTASPAVSDRIRRAFLAATPKPGERAVLNPDESHHVARVLRLKTGDGLAVFDGQGGEWDATIEEASRDRVVVTIGAARDGEVEPKIRVTLFQAIVRPEKVEWVIEKGTEIGVAAFRLVAAERGDVPPPSPARLSRYGRIVLEACKQSGRRRVPSLAVGELPAQPPETLAIVLSPAPGTEPLGAVLNGPAAGEVWLAVGPEGGFTDAEIASLVASGWKCASLGPRTLRTETAGCIAAAIVLHAWGDLGR